MTPIASPYLELLKNIINLRDIPFTDRGSRLLVLNNEAGLCVRLTERWIKRDQLLAAYRSRPPLLDEWIFTDQNGARLPVAITSYPHQLIFDTPAGQFGLVFEDPETMLLTLPPGEYGISFLARVEQTQIDWRGGILRTIGEIRRSIAYTTNAELVEHRLETMQVDLCRVNMRIRSQPKDSQPHALLINITPRLGFNRYVPDPQLTIEAAAWRWHEWFASTPPVAEPYQRAYYFAWWIMRAGLVSTRYYLTREALMPSKLHYVGVWQWDAYFHALAYRHVDIRLAQDQLRLQLDHQTPEGQIPDAIHDEGLVTHLTKPVDADVTKPPLIAWTAWQLHQSSPDVEFLREIYEPIVRWNQWWFTRNDTDHNGLCEYHHPFSSGLDDSPLWDNGMPVEPPDLNTYLYMQLVSLSRISKEIGDPVAAQQWAEQAETLLGKLIQTEWDADTGLFWPQYAGRPLKVLTPFSLFPLITGRLPQSITSRLVEHLTNPEEFWPRYPVPSVALNDPHYDPLQMWRGPTWVNVNYLLVLGLQQSGYPKLAQELRQKTLDLLMQHENIYEYYHPETGDPPPKSAPIFGWSAAVFIELAIQASQENEMERI